MYYLQSFVRTAESRKSIFALSDSTNTQRPKDAGGALASWKAKQYPRFALREPKKASATVALSSANASSVNAPLPPSPPPDAASAPSADPGASSTNVIPFPCAAEDVPVDDDPFAATPSAPSFPMDIVPPAPSGPRPKRSCPSEARRRRCVTPLTHSPHAPGKHPHKSAHAPATTPPAHENAPPHPPPPSPAARHLYYILAFTACRRKTSGAGPAPRVRSASAPSGTDTPASGARSPKRTKKSKRVVAELQFTATVHRSIVSRMKRLAADEAEKMDDGSDESLQKDLTVQDMLLVDRLWQHLLDMGCPPTLLDSSTAPTCPPDLLSPPKPVPVEQDIDMDMDIVVLSVPEVYLGPTPYIKLPPSPPSPAPSTRSLPPISQPAPATPPTSPTESSPSEDPPPSKVYTMSQLVATLIMRHRDRGTVKTRPSPPSPRKLSVLAVGPVLRAEDLA